MQMEIHQKFVNTQFIDYSHVSICSKVEVETMRHLNMIEQQQQQNVNPNGFFMHFRHGKSWKYNRQEKATSLTNKSRLTDKQEKNHNKRTFRQLPGTPEKRPIEINQVSCGYYA